MRRRLVLAFAFLAASCGDDSTGDIDGPVPDGRVDAGDAPIDADIDTPPATALCTVTAGDARKILSGTILTPTGMMTGEVAINAAGSITCVGATCAAGGETRIECPMGVISPGLINTHDHITFTQNPPYTDTGERYEHRHDWRVGRRGHTEINTPGNASQDQIRWGELRFLLGGATSTVGSGGAAGLLRNLDQAANQEGLGQPAVRFETFPLDDSSGQQVTGTCAYGAAPDTAATIAALAAYEPHIAEGIDAVSRNEFLCTSSTTYDVTPPGVSNDLVAPQTAIIHGVGLRPFDYGVMALEGTALIWSPRSNITLYGDTAQAPVADRMGVQIALGTDWSATGSINLLRELACADQMNRTYWGSHFSDRELWEMVTGNAAAVTATDDVIGSIAVGRIADIAIFDGRTHAGYRAIIDGEPKDVALVMRAGKPLYGEASTIAALVPSGCDALDVCGNAKQVCLMSEIGKNFAALQTGAGSAYGAFFCGVPTGEPTCTPRRPVAVMGSTVYTGVVSAADMDGDGVANASDDCPTVFNPIRPVDEGVQGNADGDAQGDACDVCPVNADTTTCTAVDPNDRDGDGVVNGADNCPDASNPLQEDGDTDGKGDACDACPTVSNPGTAGCPVSIYSIKNGMTPVGSTVRVVNALVTGEGSNGFFVQVKAGDAGYAGPDFSGLFVFTGATSPFLAQVAVGNRVTIDANVAVFQGQTELDAVAAVTVVAAGPEAAPAPVVVTAAEVTTGGARAAALESVLVQVGASTVTAINAAQGEFTIMDAAGTVVVDDYLFVPAPAVTVGQTFGSVTGVLALRGMVSKVEPRSAADLPAGMPVITAFGPALSFVNQGQMMVPTYPTPLTVTLNGPAAATVMVDVTSSNPAAVTVVSPLVIAAGASSGQVLVFGMGAGTATLTARIGTGPMHTAMVRTLDGTEQPVLTGLTPATAMVAPSGTLALTVALDVPAPTGGTVVNVALAPATAGTVPATVTVPAGALTATFNYIHSGTDTAATVTASLGAAMFSSAISIVTPSGTGLVINEIDYDMPGAGDSVEFVELYNGGTTDAAVTDLALILVNGNGTPAEYRRIALAPHGTPIPPGGYLVIGAAAVTSPAGTKYTPPVGTGANQWPATDAIQNGSTGIAAPGDGALIVNLATMAVLDKVSYESAITVTITGFGSINLVEGTFDPTLGDDPTAPASIARIPNGTDTNDLTADWSMTANVTPGAANAP